MTERTEHEEAEPHDHPDAACLFILAVNIVLGFVLTDQSKTAMRILIENRMLDVSNTAAALLDGDYLGRIQPDDKEKPEYREILRILTKYQENIDLAYIYCIRKVGGPEVRFHDRPLGGSGRVRGACRVHGSPVPGQPRDRLRGQDSL